MTPQTLRPRTERYLADAAALSAKNPLSAQESFRSEELHRSESTSLHLVQVRGELKPHLHRFHEETAFVVSGAGVMTLAGEESPVGPGSVMRIPKGMVHSFRSSGDSPCVVLSVFSPPFDGKDRLFVE